MVVRHPLASIGRRIDRDPGKGDHMLVEPAQKSTRPLTVENQSYAIRSLADAGDGTANSSKGIAALPQSVEK